jgi:hypothetical protein
MDIKQTASRRCKPPANCRSFFGWRSRPVSPVSPMPENGYARERATLRTPGTAVRREDRRLRLCSQP